MYKRLATEKTRQYYNKILMRTLFLSEERLLKEQSVLWNSIVNQLRDIKVMIVEKQVLSDWEDVYERYTIGTIAVREFPENDEMQARLSDIFWGAVHFKELQDNNQ